MAQADRTKNLTLAERLVEDSLYLSVVLLGIFLGGLVVWSGLKSALSGIQAQADDLARSRGLPGTTKDSVKGTTLLLKDPDSYEPGQLPLYYDNGTNYVEPDPDYRLIGPDRPADNSLLEDEFERSN